MLSTEDGKVVQEPSIIFEISNLVTTTCTNEYDAIGCKICITKGTDDFPLFKLLGIMELFTC